MCVQAFLNGSIGVHLPSPEQWANAYYNNLETAAIIRFVQNPGTIANKGLKDAKLNANFCIALHQSHLSTEDGLHIYRQPITGSNSYAHLVEVPTQLRNLVLIAFHRNFVGGHLYTAHSFNRIRLCFYWPNMHTNITKMCHSCLGCALSNSVCRESRELI